jgi:hypothetical protein
MQQCVSSGENVYQNFGEELAGWYRLIPANWAVRISGSFRQ